MTKMDMYRSEIDPIQRDFLVDRSAAQPWILSSHSGTMSSVFGLTQPLPDWDPAINNVGQIDCQRLIWLEVIGLSPSRRLTRYISHRVEAGISPAERLTSPRLLRSPHYVYKTYCCWNLRVDFRAKNLRQSRTHDQFFTLQYDKLYVRGARKHVATTSDRTVSDREQRNVSSVA